MTKSQIRKQNHRNAQMSTGPKTVEGKNNSRKNALKHGLTAETLTLPGENTQEIQARADLWHETCQPETFVEETLVDQLAITHLRLMRLAKIETATVADQVRYAESEWDFARQTRLRDLIQLFQTEPARALIGLKAFGAGVQWLLDRWNDLKFPFDKIECWNNIGIIREALKLSGYDTDKMNAEPFEAYMFAFYAAYCSNDPMKQPDFKAFYTQQKTPQWIARFNTEAYCDRKEAVIGTRQRMDSAIAELTALVALFAPIDAASRAGAGDRAIMLHDTAQNRLFVRYLKSAESSYDRTLKTLIKVQADRRETALEAAANAAPRYEPVPDGHSHGKRIEQGGYVTLNGLLYLAENSSDGHLSLVATFPTTTPPVATFVPTSADVVPPVFGVV